MAIAAHPDVFPFTACTAEFLGHWNDTRKHVVDNRGEYRSTLPPDGIDPHDVLSYPMEPGAVLWNQLLTPH